jgi:hypothetical protein
MTPDTQYSWTETANGLAQQVHTSYSFVERGVVPLRLVDDSVQPPRLVDDAQLVVGVFGNDNYLGDDKTRKEVEHVRTQLRHLPDITEIGFGLSTDGQTWALLVATDKDRYHTKAGQVFQKELLKAALEQVVWSAWRNAAGMPADNALEDGVSQGAPQGGAVNR